MLQLAQFRYGADNLGYLLHGATEALAVDGGAVAAMLAYLDQHHLTLNGIANTHSHADHTLGNALLHGETGALILSPAEQLDSAVFHVDASEIRVLSTPGHSLDARCFLAEGMILTGDTLFNGTIGNCFSGDLMAFFGSIRRLLSLPPETAIYAGHDYVHDAVAFARWLEPDNPHLDAYLRAYRPERISSTLAQERLVNPYLRFNDPGIVAIMAQRGLPVGTEEERWQSLMSIE